tara:strand:- start:408 stop:935 length:528 start_codon:yes stop_codon:yes gene_type:complete
MNTIINNIENRILKLKFGKIYILFFLMIFFSILYMLLDDTHFEGVNKFKEIVKEEVIKDKVQETIKESFNNIQNYYENNKILNSNSNNNNNNNNISNKEEKIIEKATKETEIETEIQELDEESVQPSIINKYLNRLYFAIITGCLLGYGDIYPITNYSKFLASMQGLLTVILIIY